MNLKIYIKATLMFFKRRTIKPIFIVGCGHSGTSIVISILDNHEQIHAIKKETSIFYESKIRMLATIFSWFKKANKLGKPYLAEKTPMHIYKIKEMLAMFPNTRVILMLRDGRDVACSIRERTGEFEKGVDKWLADNSEGYKYWSHPSVKVVRLEDLTADGPKVLQSVCDFIGIEYQEQMLNKQGKEKKFFYTQKITNKEDFNTQNTSGHHAHVSKRNWQINQGLFASTQRWKEDLSEEELKIFNHKAKKHLQLYGYE